MTVRVHVFILGEEVPFVENGRHALFGDDAKLADVYTAFDISFMA